MREALGTILVALLMVTAGCEGLVGDDGTPTPTESGEKTVTETETEVATATATQTETPSAQEREHILSGKAFNKIVRLRMEARHETTFVSSTANRDKSVKMTVRLPEDKPLYWGMMDVTQTASLAIAFRTTTDDEVAMSEGTTGALYRPEGITVDVQDPSGEHIGTFEIGPDTANQYARLEYDANIFGQNVADSLELETDYERGEHKPGWYLNRSQLSDWSQMYATVTEKRNEGYTMDLPTSGVTYDPSTMRLYHNFTWDSEAQDQAFVSARGGSLR